MAELGAITAIEGEFCGPNGKPSLGRAFELLRDRWEAGLRDRETSLRLLFLAWFAYVEPPFLTGLPAIEDTSPIFREMFEALGGPESLDGEFLAVSAYMIAFAPEFCGPEGEWQVLAERCAARAPRLGRDLAPAVFHDRGAYGEYFEHIAHARG